jgi:hypothetical protein
VLSKPALIQWAANCAADEAGAWTIDNVRSLAALNEAALRVTVDALVHAEIPVAMRRWATAHTRQRDAAASRGTEVHRIVEALSQGHTPEIVPAETVPYLVSLERLVRDHPPVIVHAESGITSAHGYAGTLDAILRYGRRLVIRDYKTRKDERRARLYGEEALQLAAYRHADWLVSDDGAATPMPRIHAAEVVLLWPSIGPDDPGYRIERVDAGRETFRAFLHVLDIYRWRRQHGVDNG